MRSLRPAPHPAPRRSGRLAAAAVVALVLLALSAPAHALPTPQIRGVYQAQACGGGECGPGDPTVARGSSVAGTIQIQVAAENDLRPMEWIRLEARFGNDPRWICLQHWPANDQRTFSGSFDWRTTNWPNPGVDSNCIHNSPHYHGRAAANGAYQVRVVARERVLANENPGDHEGHSDPFSFSINNAPATPTWSKDPAAETEPEPAVTLQWTPNREPGLREYVIVRRDPRGRETETPVSATKPARQGCSRIGDLAIRCIDDDFPTRYGGTYRYAIIARRTANAGPGRCALTDQRCIESPLSEPREVFLDGPAPGGGRASPTPAPTGLPTSIAQPFPSPAPTGGSRFDAAPTPSPAPSGFAAPPLPAGSSDQTPLPTRGLLGPAGFLLAAGFGGWLLRRAVLARR